MSVSVKSPANVRFNKVSTDYLLAPTIFHTVN